MPDDFDWLPKDGEGFVFVVVLISYDTMTDSLGIDPVGVYSNLKTAMSYAAELESASERSTFFSSPSEITFDVLEFRMDEEPMMLGMLKKRKKKMQEDLDQAIIKLMKQGIVDQLVGEDGNFYYTLTDKGEDRIKSMKLPKYIKKLFNRKND
tara:strand:- start:948 stop:1403 length:456 start_codon:yes stop_codon:yes gene_type:complete